MKQDPATNRTHLQQDLAINRIHSQGSGTRHSSAFHQPYQLYLPQRTYQTVAEEFGYKVIDDYLLEDFPNVGYTKEKPDKGKVFYTT